MNDPGPFFSPVLSNPSFVVLSVLQTSLETKIERKHERNETKRGRNKSAKWRKTGRQTKKEGKKLNDTKMGKNKRSRERVVRENKERNSMSLPASSWLPWVRVWYVLLHKVLLLMCPAISTIVLRLALFLWRDRQPLFIFEAMKMVTVRIFTVIRLCLYMLSKYSLLFVYSNYMLRYKVAKQSELTIYFCNCRTFAGCL